MPFGSDPALKRQVAVKVSSVSRHGADLRFEREAEVLAQLAHPNIVPIHSMGVDSEGRPFYAMKLVKGRTLQEILVGLRKREPGLEREYPLFALLDLFRKVCDAMAFAHSRRILHRDLKPDNIMVGEYGEVLVMDWGLAKHLEGMDPGQLGAGRAGSGQFPEQTMEGEVMGTPLYMSPEQAAGRVSELDERSDIYALGAILYAILTLEPPIEGRTTEEVLSRVRIGQIRPMRGNPGFSRRIRVLQSKGLGRGIPEALKAVTLKAMALEPGSRYRSVSELTAELEAYRNGFATEAEAAGALKRMRLWMGRNRILAGSVSVLLTVVSVFTIGLIRKERVASNALASLRETAPTFAQRARDALQNGQLESALEAATFAGRLDPGNSEYHVLRGNVLQVLVRWPDAIESYRTALRCGGDSEAARNLVLTEDLMRQSRAEGEIKAKAALFESLNSQQRFGEALVLGQGLGDFWKDRKKDLSVLPQLVKRLEEKLLPVPGTRIRMSKTEVTVGEWKLYLKADGLPGWVQPSSDWVQTDEHPVVNVSWNQASEFCNWLSAKAGKKWRLPSNSEWDAAVGNTAYPWGDYYPPNWDDGNYTVSTNGERDGQRVGVDAIRGTAPVASFKPNPLGFYDLGGNIWEMMADGNDEKTARLVIRGASWVDFVVGIISTEFRGVLSDHSSKADNIGIRLVQEIE